MTGTLTIKHGFMGKPLEQRVMHASYFVLAGDKFQDPYCVHAVTLADTCRDCDQEIGRAG